MPTQSDKRAIVTGAGSGIGRATVVALVEDGWRVLAVDLRSDRLQPLAEELGDRVVPMASDITANDAPHRIVAEAQRALGGIDLLVNNAGMSWIGPFADMPDDKLDAVMGLNVRALMRLTRQAIPVLEGSPRAQIVNIASAAAHLPMDTIAVYCASKAAVLMFSRVLARELAAKKIRVNALSPGGTNTNLFASVGSTLDTSSFIDPADQGKMVVALTQLPAGIDVVETISDQRFNVTG